MNVIQELITQFNPESIQITNTSTKNKSSITISKKEVKQVIAHLVTHSEFTHLITITAIDNKEDIELCYHFSNGSQILTVRTHLINSDPTIATITDLTVKASLYEREVHDLFGIIFQGHPNLSPLLLPDGWPTEIHPLKKEWTYNKIQSIIDKK